MTSSPVRFVDEFVAKLVKCVRDPAIRECDAQLDPQAKGRTAERWRAAGREGRLTRTLVPDCVDSVLYYLLLAIDLGHIDIRYVAESGEVASLDGSQFAAGLAGEFIGDDEWLKANSTERYWRESIPVDISEALATYDEDSPNDEDDPDPN